MVQQYINHNMIGINKIFLKLQKLKALKTRKASSNIIMFINN